MFGRKKVDKATTQSIAELETVTLLAQDMKVGYVFMCNGVAYCVSELHNGAVYGATPAHGYADGYFIKGPFVVLKHSLTTAYKSVPTKYVKRGDVVLTHAGVKVIVYSITEKAQGLILHCVAPDGVYTTDIDSFTVITQDVNVPAKQNPVR